MTQAMKTTRSIKKEEVKPNWYIIDAKGMNLGRLAVKVATLIKGKNKVTYAPNLLSGDHVIIVNAKGIEVSTKKVENKEYHAHSGYPGGLKTLSFSKFMAKNPSTVVKIAVKGMLPKTKMGDKMLSLLHVYNDDKHPHEAQTPIKL